MEVEVDIEVEVEVDEEAENEKKIEVEVEVEVEVELEVDEEEEKKKKRKIEDKKSHQYPSRVIQLRGSRPQGQLVKRYTGLIFRHFSFYNPPVFQMNWNVLVTCQI